MYPGDELTKGGPVEPENTLLPWVDYLAYCKPHHKPVVGHQLGFMVVGVMPAIPTRKGMCEICLRELGHYGSPSESAES